MSGAPDGDDDRPGPGDGRGEPWWSSDEPAPEHLDPRLQAGLDHLQRAAREVIAASRALLDVAEELVDDPKAAAGVVDLLGSLGALAAKRARSAPWAGHGADRSADDDDRDEGDDDPPVQRIPVS